MKKTTVVRTLAAVAALSVPMTALSVGANVGTDGADWEVPAGHVPGDRQSSAISERLARTLTGIELQRENGGLSVLVTGDGVLVHEETMLDRGRLVIDIPHVTSSLQKPVVRVNHPLLKQVRLGYHVDKVRLVFDLTGQADYVIEPQGANLLIKFRSTVAENVIPTGHTVAIPQSPTVETEKTESVAASVKGKRWEPTQSLVLNGGKREARRAAPAFHVRPVQMKTQPEAKGNFLPTEDLVLGETRYVGRRISLDFQQAEITNVLRLIAEVSGFNVVIGDGVKSKVTMKLVSVPWDQALDMILKMNGLGKIKQGNILWIDTLANIAKQENEAATAKSAKTQSEDLVDRVFYIRNLTAAELYTALRQSVSPRGRLMQSPGTNALVVRDTETQMAVIKQLIEGLDLQVPQVQIEARIVQADTVYARGLGVQWGVKNTDFGSNSFSAAGNLTGPFAPVAGTGAGGTIPRDFIVNLPAQVAGLPAVPAVGYSFGKLVDGFALDLRLSAGELLGLAKVIAAPKVTTLDKREAKMSQGESIPFQTTSLQGTQTTFVDANLELNVTPQIMSRDPKEVGKQIMMKVRATRNAVGARSNPAGPSIDRREANTQVIVRDGETMVIGGVFIDTQNNNVQGVPYLSRIPVLGWLFKNKSESVSKQELLIFLTPTILRR
ncbi:type IV pilus secretin PilQ [Petrachloros mirabilis]